MKVDIFTTDKKYDIIYADPPWRFNVWSRKTGLARSADKHYQTMTKEEIENLPIHKITNKNGVLFLWVTAPLLEQGLELIKKWGFKYKTFGFAWGKLNKKTENLLLVWDIIREQMLKFAYSQQKANRLNE